MCGSEGKKRQRGKREKREKRENRRRRKGGRKKERKERKGERKKKGGRRRRNLLLCVGCVVLVTKVSFVIVVLVWICMNEGCKCMEMIVG